jgi:RNA polymerase sigma-70 factor (ECF subfamily)
VGVGRSGATDPDEVPEPLSEIGEDLDEQIYGRLALLARLIDRVQAEFESDTWRAFWLTVFDGLSGEDAAAQLGKSAAAVYMAKSRVLARLREAAGELSPTG